MSEAKQWKLTCLVIAAVACGAAVADHHRRHSLSHVDVRIERYESHCDLESEMQHTIAVMAKSPSSRAHEQAELMRRNDAWSDWRSTRMCVPEGTKLGLPCSPGDMPCLRLESNLVRMEIALNRVWPDFTATPLLP